MKSLVALLESLLAEAGRMSAAPVKRDVETLRSRAKHEGDSFITITLPTFCRDFERSLADGRIAPGSFASFKKLKTGIPAFLQGFLCNVFGSDGVLLSEPSVVCIRLVRQICLFGKKLNRPCTSARQVKAIDDYRKCDSEVVAMPMCQLTRWYELTAKILISSLKLTVDYEAIRNLKPRHGPGATQERISGNQKYVFRRWHQRLTDVGLTYFGFGAPAAFTDELPIVENVGSHCGFPTLEQYAAVQKLVDLGLPDFVEPEDEKPVRVTLVPKTLKTPRIIAIEPVCMQYAQQALGRYLVDRIDQCDLTSGHVNFTRQYVNQVLAEEGSRSGVYATLDLSEASDRVSLDHVRRLFRTNPGFLDWLEAARSTRAKLPNGDVIPLKKFASMGSALCFPVESLVFFTSIIASRLYRAGRFPTAHSVLSSGRDVYVYGDDLIVPADEAAAISVDLETLGFKVNQHKSFWTGKFRESCGAEYYDGEKVNVVYLRRDLPATRGDASRIVSSVATANQLWSAGFVRTAAAIQKAVETCIGRLPHIRTVETPVIGWLGTSSAEPRRRTNRDLQRSECLCWCTETPRRYDPLEGYGALAKCLGRIKGSPSSPLADISAADPLHLESTPRRYGLALKRKWVPSILL